MKDYKIKINGNEYNVQIDPGEDNKLDVFVDGKVFHVELDKPVAAPKQFAPKAATISAPSVAAPTTAAAAAPSGASGEKVVSPLPGVILDIAVKEGDTVKRGDKVCILEAMKMENVIEATADGVIKEIKVKKSDSVLEGDVIAVIG